MRSGCTFKRGFGKIFFFSPGDQDYPVYRHKDVRRVIANGVEWVRTLRPERTDRVLLRYEIEDSKPATLTRERCTIDHLQDR